MALDGSFVRGSRLEENRTQHQQAIEDLEAYERQVGIVKVDRKTYFALFDTEDLASAARHRMIVARQSGDKRRFLRECSLYLCLRWQVRNGRIKQRFSH